jgi:beta-galactosidase
VRGEVGIVYAPETQVFAYAQQGSADYYARSLQGAYRGFFDLNIQADWVHIDHIDEYDFLYLPYPVMLTQKTADHLKTWVAAGGTLVCEGCPGYFGDRGHAGTVQPNLGLDEVFGVKENYVEFTPDLLANLRFRTDDTTARGGLFLQAYEPVTGTAAGWYGDGRVAVVDNRYGKGTTRLVGTMPGAGYFEHPGDRSNGFFTGLMRFAGKPRHVKSSDSRIKARLCDGPGGVYLWAANPMRKSVRVRLEIDISREPFSTGRSLWGAAAKVADNRISLSVGARDVSVIALE